MRHHAPVHRLLCASLALLAPACVGAPVDDADSAAESIVNGAPASAALTGVVRVQSTFHACTGALLTNSWVLSARSCFSDDDVRDPSRVSVSLNGATQFGAEVIVNQSRDVALVRLAAPHALGLLASTRAWEVNLFSGSLQGRTVRCMGYGRSHPGDAGVTSTLLRADMTVTSASGEMFTVSPNSSGQVPRFDDRGGPCFVSMPDGRQLLAGVASTFTNDPSTRAALSASYLNASYIRGWAAEVLSTQELVLRHSGRCVRARDIAAGGLDQRTCDGDRDQRWRFERGVGQTFRMRDSISGRCLTAATASSAAGQPLALTPCLAYDPGQVFVLNDMGGGYRRLMNFFSGRCLDVTNGSAVDGIGLQQSACTTGHSQQFSLRVHAEEVAYELSSVNSLRCVDVPTSGTGVDLTQVYRPGELAVISGARIRQSSCTLGANQRFRLEEVAGGEFRVHPQHSNLCFDIPDASTADGAQVQQYPCHGGTNQRFRMVFQAQGQYQLQNVNSGRCLEVPSTGASDGALLRQAGCHSGPNQRWAIRL